MKTKSSILFGICCMVLLLLVAACDSGGSGGYDIGDIGPAGGHIFYIDEANQFDWTYLEAAPRVAEAFGKQWGDMGVLVGGDAALTGIGDGQAATTAIVAHMEAASITDTAAQYCDSLNSNGYGDWFLPSLAELSLMQANLYQENIGQFDWTYYWSSSEHDADEAKHMIFQGSGGTGTTSKDYNGYFTRAARAF